MKTTKQIVVYLREAIRQAQEAEARAKWQHLAARLRGRASGLQTALRAVETYRRERELDDA